MYISSKLFVSGFGLISPYLKIMQIKRANKTLITIEPQLGHNTYKGYDHLNACNTTKHI